MAYSSILSQIYGFVNVNYGILRVLVQISRFEALAFVRNGFVYVNDGRVYYVGENGGDWSRTSSDGAAWYLDFGPLNVNSSNNWVRWLGIPLRCLYPGSA